ncbi:DUF1287 domain-containing protein [Rhizosphaericola mali]|uniref:DUF1287 domain-containing protein n=1 Tax=Rhizosphaericola mali TaxID=2545455 RepID=A0A5P2GAL8_9BACT|nr:DUF1287 domain-containing protein [Rhizosphaericola mali]QES90233.1 DUF1287 domain-containing protein [Rhizosphaericola mali]
MHILLLTPLIFTNFLGCYNSKESTSLKDKFYYEAPKNSSQINDELDSSDFYYRLSASAVKLTFHHVSYDANYFSISYPNGDIPKDKGVCCDVIIRAYRAVGIDLQKLVHEDMKKHFSEYPRLWGLKHTDTNIDHRRVPNLMCYFNRKNASVSISNKANDYHYGDIVTWDLGNGQTHIGIVSHLKNAEKSRPLIVHNIGSGQILSDCLFQFKIIGHYRYKISV